MKVPAGARYNWNARPPYVGILSEDGSEAQWKLSAGANVFLEATALDGSIIETDKSNCLLEAMRVGDLKQAAKRRPAAAQKRPAAALKRPAAAASATDAEDEGEEEEEESSEEEEEEEAVSEAGPAVQKQPAAAQMRLSAAAPVRARPAAEEGVAVPGRSYGIDWYKRDGRVGVKLRHGKKNQLCSFGGAACKNEVSQEQLMAIGHELVDELVAGRVAETTAAARQFADDRIKALLDPHWS